MKLLFLSKVKKKKLSVLTDANNLYESRIKERDSRIKELKQQIEEAQTKQNELTKQGKEQRTAMNQLQERIRNFNSLSQKVQDQLSKLDPDIAVYTKQIRKLA